MAGAGAGALALSAIDDFLRFRARSLCNFRLVARAACDSSQL